MDKTNYLADWLSGKLSDEALKQLVSNADFEAYQQIRDTLSNSVISTPTAQESYAALQYKMAHKPTTPKTRRLPIWSYAVAACLILSLGGYNLYVKSNEQVTGFGANTSLVLSEGSKVTLNARSKVEYANLFGLDRSIALEGEAFFEVEKGSTFEVETPLGKVRVLGTQFNVASFADFFEVNCYHGKVSVLAKGKTTVLTAGESVRFYGQSYENWADELAASPQWIKGETSLKKVPMKYVWSRFEAQFNTKVRYPQRIAQSLFSGSFSNTNRSTALQSICLPLNLKHKTLADGTIQIVE